MKSRFPNPLDQYNDWKNSVLETFHKGYIDFDQITPTTNSLIKTKHIQSPFEEWTEDFLDEFAASILSLYTDTHIKTDKTKKKLKNLFLDFIEILIQFIDFDEDSFNNSSKGYQIHDIWKYFNTIRRYIFNPNCLFYTTYQNTLLENPLVSLLAKFDNNFYNKIFTYFQTNFQLQLSMKSQANSESKYPLICLERINSTLQLLKTIWNLGNRNQDCTASHIRTVKSILDYIVLIFSNMSKTPEEKTLLLKFYRTFNESQVDENLTSLTSLAIGELKQHFVASEITICTNLALCPYLNKQLFGLNKLSKVLNQSLTSQYECQVLYQMQFIDQILANSDLHESLVKPYTEIFIKMMRCKLINKKEHLKLYWDMVVQQHPSTINAFLTGLEAIITASATRASYYAQNDSLYGASLFDSEMTENLVQIIIEKNSYPHAVILFLGKNLLALNQHQKSMIFEKLNQIYFKMNEIQQSNEAEEVLNFKSKYIKDLINVLCLFIPKDCQQIEQTCFEFIRNQNDVHLNYAMSLLQAIIMENSIDQNKASEYLTLILDSIAKVSNDESDKDASEYLLLLSRILFQLPQLSKEQFNRILEITKPIFLSNPRSITQFFDTLISKASHSIINRHMIKKLFKTVCKLCENDSSCLNDHMELFMKYLYAILSQNCDPPSNPIIKYVWDLVLNTGNDVASAFLVSIYLDSNFPISIQQFIDQCIQNINNVGALKSILSMIDSLESQYQMTCNYSNRNLFNAYSIFNKPNLYINESEDFYSIKLSGAFTADLKMHCDSTYDDIRRKAAAYMNTNFHSIALYSPITNNIITRDNFTIYDQAAYRVLTTPGENPMNRNLLLPSQIILGNEKYSQALFDTLSSDDDNLAKLAYTILNKIPPLQLYTNQYLHLTPQQLPSMPQSMPPIDNNDQKATEGAVVVNSHNEKLVFVPESSKTQNQCLCTHQSDEAEYDEGDDVQKSNEKDGLFGTEVGIEEEESDSSSYEESPKNEVQQVEIESVSSGNDIKWNEIFDHKYKFLYFSNTIGNLLKFYSNTKWVQFFFETNGAIDFLKYALTEKSVEINGREALLLLRIAVLIVKQQCWDRYKERFSLMFDQTKLISQIMAESNEIEINLKINLLNSLTTENSSLINLFNEQSDLIDFIKKMLFNRNRKIRKAIQNLLAITNSQNNESQKEKQEDALISLLQFAIANESTNKNYFDLLIQISNDACNPQHMWIEVVSILFTVFLIPQTDDFIERITFSMPTTDLAIYLIQILCNLSQKNLEPMAEEEKLLDFVIDNVLFNGTKYFQIDSSVFSLLTNLVRRNQAFQERVITKVESVLDEFKTISEQNNQISTYPLSYSPYRGIKNLGATCYINSSIQQLFSINGMKKLVLDSYYSNEDWTGNLQLAFSQLLLYPTSCIDLTPFVKHWDGWDGVPINPHEQQDAVEFIQMLFGRMEDKMPSFKSLFEGTFQNHFQSSPTNGSHINYESDTFDHFTMLPLEVKGMTCIQDSFRSFIQPLVISDYKVENYNGFTGKIDVEKYSMIKNAPEILIIQLKRFEFNLSLCRREKVNQKYMFSYEIDLAPIMVDQNEPVIYELFGIQMHSGSAEGGHYYSFIKCPDRQIYNSTDDVSYSWYKFDDSIVTKVDSTTLIDDCSGGEKVYEYFDSVSNQTIYQTSENISNAYMLYYKKKNIEHDEIQVENVIKGMNQNLISNLSKEIKIIINSNILISPMFTKWLSEDIIQYDFSGKLVYTLFTTSLKNSTYSKSIDPQCEQYITLSIQLLESQNVEYSPLANYICTQNADILNFLLYNPNRQVRFSYFRLLNKAIEFANQESRSILIATIETTILNDENPLTKYFNYDTFFLPYLSMSRNGFVIGQWRNVFVVFLQSIFIPYCAAHENLYKTVDLTAFFQIFNECQILMNESEQYKPVKKRSLFGQNQQYHMEYIDFDLNLLNHFLLSPYHIHAFSKFLSNYPVFDLSSLFLSNKQFSIEKVEPSLLARYYVLTIWLIDKPMERLSCLDLIKNNPGKEAQKVSLTKILNDSIKFNKIITDFVTDSKREENFVVSFLNELDYLAANREQPNCSTNLVSEFHGSYMNSLKPSLFYSNQFSYSTSSLLQKFIASDSYQCRMAIYAFTSNIITDQKPINTFSNQIVTIDKRGYCVLLNVYMSRIDNLNTLITKTMSKLSNEAFASTNPSTQYFGLLGKLIKKGEFEKHFAVFDNLKCILPILKSFCEYQRKKALFDLLGFLSHAIGKDNCDSFFTPVTTGSQSTIDSKRIATYTEFIQCFHKLTIPKEILPHTFTANPNNSQNLSQDDVEECYYDDDTTTASTESKIFQKFNCLFSNLISFIPSFGYDIFFSSKVFDQCGYIMFIEAKDRPFNGANYKKLLIDKSNEQNCLNIGHALFKYEILVFYLINFNQHYFSFVCKYLRKYQAGANNFFIQKNDTVQKPLMLFLIQTIKNNQSKLTSDQISLICKAAGYVIHYGLLFKQSIIADGVSEKKKSDECNRVAKIRKLLYDLMNNTFSLRSIFELTLSIDKKGPPLLFYSYTLLSKDMSFQAFELMNNMMYIKSVHDKAKKYASSMISSICYANLHYYVMQSLAHWCLHFSMNTIKPLIDKLMKNINSSKNNIRITSQSLLYNTIKNNIFTNRIKKAESLLVAEVYDLDDEYFEYIASQTRSPLILFEKILNEGESVINHDKPFVKHIASALDNMLTFIYLTYTSICETIDDNKQTKTFSELAIQSADNFMSCLFQEENSMMELSNRIIDFITKVYSSGVYEARHLIQFIYNKSDQSHWMTFNFTKETIQSWVDSSALDLITVIKASVVKPENLVKYSNLIDIIFYFIQNLVDTNADKDIKWPVLNIKESELTQIAFAQFSRSETEETLAKLSSLASFLPEESPEEEENKE